MKRQRKDRRKPREILCEKCREIFIRNISDEKFNNGEFPIFCSRRCIANSKSIKRKERYDRKKPRELMCKNCQNMFIKKISDKKYNNNEFPEFCSRKCAGKYQGLKNKGEHNGMYGKKAWSNGLTKETDERLLLISEKKSGENHHQYGIPLSEKQRKKQSDSLRANKDFMKWCNLSMKDRMKQTYGENWEIKYNEWKDKLKGIHSKEWFISKYGELEGSKLYNKRCKNISKNSSFKKYNKDNKQNYSNISQEIFWKIYNQIKDKYTNIYFAELNNEYSCGTGLYNYDFVIKDIKIVIEFNGCKFHPREGDYSWKSPYGISYEEQRTKDADKLERAINNGYRIYYIWEDENIENKIKELLTYM